MTLTEFLEARIAEDEARFDLPEFVLEDSAHGYGWGTRGDCPLCGAYQFSGLASVTEEGWWAHTEDAHRRRQRLAECAAKRAIIGQWNDPASFGPFSDGVEVGIAEGIDTAVRALASVYASHPDYRQEWAL